MKLGIEASVIGSNKKEHERQSQSSLTPRWENSVEELVVRQSGL